MTSNPLDLTRLATVLQSHGVVVDGTLTAVRLGQGQSNLTFRVTDQAGSAWVVRRPPRGAVLQSAHDVMREARIIDALRDSGVPVPQVLATVGPGEVCESPAVVMELLAGGSLDEKATVESLDSSARQRIGQELVETLALIHSVDLTNVGLADLARHDAYAGRQLRRWSRQWEQSRTRNLPALDQLTQWLEKSVPQESPPTLLHGDLHLRNILVGTGEGRVVGVLDWELSTLGDPIADLGTTLAYWPSSDDPHSGLFGPTGEPGFSSREDLVDAYSVASGRDVANVRFWHALGLWKIAIIAEGVIRRVRNDPTNAATHAPVEPQMVNDLIDASWNVVHATSMAI